MKRGLILIFFASLVFLGGCHGPQDKLDDVTRSHLEANVPAGGIFEETLMRDLDRYFCRPSTGCRVAYEFLRNGPTQSGVSYPTYYLWVKTIKNGAVAVEGAARVAAVRHESFEVTDFLSREQISRSSAQVTSIFPVALEDRITEKANSAAERGERPRRVK